MPTTAIAAAIALAKEHEKQTGHLAKLLTRQLRSHLHHTIKVPGSNGLSALLDFVQTYIEEVPRFLLIARSHAEAAGVTPHTNPVLHVAEQFFLKPVEIDDKPIALAELLDEAYIAHRLLEELNDRFMSRMKKPLIPKDLSSANLIIHSLIGEPFANELDEAVHFTLENHRALEKVYRSPPQSPAAAVKDTTWPCLSDEFGVQLQFGI